MHPQNYPLWCAELHEDGSVRSGLIIGWVDGDSATMTLRPMVAFHATKNRPLAEVRPATNDALLFTDSARDVALRRARQWHENTDERLTRDRIMATLLRGKQLTVEDATWAWTKILHHVTVFSEHAGLIFQAGTITAVEGNTITLTFFTPLHARMAQGKDYARLLTEAIEHVLERPMEVRYEVVERPQSSQGGQSLS